jgi:hypothetical protein
METIVSRSVGRVDQGGIVGTLGRGITSHTMAVAELIDNAIAARSGAIASGIHMEPIQIIIRFQSEGDGATSLSIRDTSTGMATGTVQQKLFDYARRNEEIDSLNEFGVGAKEALGYLAGEKGRFTLKTTYSDPVSRLRTVTAIEETTLSDVYNDKIGYEVRTRDAEPGEPTGTMWTILSIKGGMNALQQEVLFRQLGGMYRRVISLGDVVIKGEDSNGKSHVITYETPKLLKAHPMFGTVPDFEQPEILWKVNFSFDWEPPKNLDIPGGVMHIEGWIGCLERMLKDQDGIAIIRRGRVVQMGGRAQWTPAPKIFKNTGSPLDKRLVGELYCDQIPTTKIKSEIDTRISDPLALELRRQIDQLSPNVMKQADKYRDAAYGIAYAEWKHAHSGNQKALVAPAATAGTAETESGAGANTGSKTDDVVNLNYGKFTNPADSSTFSVQLVAANKGHGSSIDWKWSSGSQDKVLSIVVSRLLLKSAVSDPDDETVWLAVRIIAALALSGRQGDEEAQVARNLLKLAENIVKEQ